MNGSNPARREWLAAAMACAGLGCVPMYVWALDPPVGKVILSITGKIRNRNDGEAAAFDIAALARLPQHSFFTRTPWYPQPRKFTGVLLSELLSEVGAQGQTLKAIALNDYRVDIPSDDLTRNGALLAYLLDDKPMPVRDRGPLAIIYPFDEKPELRTAVHYSRAVWQLKRLELR